MTFILKYDTIYTNLNTLKKLLFVVMVLGTLATTAQTFQPLFPRCSYAAGSVEYRKYYCDQIMKDLDYRKTFLLFVNAALEKSGENSYLNGGKPLGDQHVSWIVSKINFDSVHIESNKSFTNTRKLKSGKVEFYEDNLQKNFIAGTFKYRSCNLTFVKADCFNFIELPNSSDVIAQQSPEENLFSAQPISLDQNIQQVKTIYRDTVIYRYSYKDVEVEREKRASDAHTQRSTSNSQSWNSSSYEEVNQVDYSRGAGVSFNAGGVFQTVCALAGIGGGYSSDYYGGNLGITITPREEYHSYSSSTGRSSGASSGSYSSTGGNQQYQQQGNQRYQKGTYSEYNNRDAYRVVSGYGTAVTAQ